MAPTSTIHRVATIVALLSLLVGAELLADQWQFIRAFPDTSVTQGNSVHGLAVDPEGKLWVQFWNSMPRDSIKEANGLKTPVRAIYIFDRFGNKISFSPITVLIGAGVNDTLFVTPTARAVTNRGLTRDHQGNILASVFDALYRLDYRTGAVLNKVKPFPGIALAAAGVDANGDIVIGTVLPGNPLKIFDKDFNYLGNVTSSADGYSRSLTVSKDGKDVYYAGYTLHAVFRYHSDNGVLGPYVLADTILKGFDCESFARHPKTNYVWASAGSGNDMPNRYPGVYTNWSPHTWYAYDPAAKQVVDTISWMNLTDTYNTRPRATAFSSAGDTVYIGSFGFPSSYWWYPPVQMFVHVGPFEMKANIVLPDTMKFNTVYLGYPDTVTVTLLNNGKDTLRVSSMTVDNAEFAILGSTSFTLARGWSRKLSVVLNPTSVGPKNAVLTILSNAVDSVKRVQLAGTAALPPAIAVSPATLSFVVNEGDSAAQTLNIKNSGTGTLEWNITVLPAAASESPFTLPLSGATIAAGPLESPGILKQRATIIGNQVPVGISNAVKNPTRDASKDIVRTARAADEGALIARSAGSNRLRVATPASLPFYDSFESGNFSEWDIDGQSGVQEVTNTTAAQGSYSFHSQSTQVAHFQGIHRDFAAGSQPASIGFYVRPGSNTVSHAYCVFTGDTSRQDAIWFFARRTGRFYVNADIGGDESYVYSPMQWYFIEFRNIDWTAKNFDYYVNDVLVKADIPMRNAQTVNAIQRLYLYNYEIGDAWWDAISVGWQTKWLTTSPESGTTQPGNTDAVQVKVKTGELGPGQFGALLAVNNNDPTNEVVKVPVTVTIVGKPNLVYPESVHIAKTTYIGFPDTAKILLRSTGSEHLVVLNVSVDKPEFSIVGPTLFAIPSKTSRDLGIRINPTSPGPMSATITITSNDPDSIARIKITGIAAHPPKMVVTPDSFSAALMVGDSVSTQMTISNSAGLGQLSFRISTFETFISPQPAAGRLPQRSWGGVSSEKLDGWKFATRPLLSTAGVSRNTMNKSNAISGSTLVSYLPLLVQDKIGDGDVADIAELRGSVAGGNLNIGFVFAPGVKLDSLIAGIYIDIDRNPATGRREPAYYHDLGVEYYAFYYGKLLSSLDSIRITDTLGVTKSVPYQIEGQEIRFSVPLSMLNHDDGAMDIVAISGIPSRPTDWAPDVGHVTIFPIPLWLAVQPDSGTVGPGGNTTLTLKVHSGGMIGGQYNATVVVTGNDPAKPHQEVPFALNLTGIPKLAVSSDTLDFGQTYIGHSSTNSIIVSSVGTDRLIGTVRSDNPRFVALDSVLSVSVGDKKVINVRFTPAATGAVTGLLAITSNADSLLTAIFLRGVGVIAPNVKTDSTALRFAGGNRDTLSSSFKIFNTGGGDLIVKITDEEHTATPEFIYAATSDQIHKIDLTTKSIVQSLPLHFFANTMGLAFSGEEIFANDGLRIVVFDPQTGISKRDLLTNISSIDGLAYLNGKLYALHPYLNQIYVLDPATGAVADTLKIPVGVGGGLDGANGRLFATGGTNVHEINPTNGAVIRTFSLGGYESYTGLAFSGSRLFVCNFSYPSKILELDPTTGARKDSLTIGTYPYWALAGGVPTDAKWLTVDRPNLTLRGGDSTVVKVKVVAAGLTKGIHRANITLSSNDPDHSKLIIPVTISVLTGVKEDNTLPVEFALYQNYPNPFNPATTIAFDLPVESKVVINVFNVIGQRVTTLVDEVQPAGRYKILWNAAGYSTGTYFLRIQAGDFIDTKKLMLVK